MERKSNKKAEGKEKKSLTKKNAAVPEEPKAETSESSSSTTEETAAAVPAVIPANEEQGSEQSASEETKPAENVPTEAEKTEEASAPQRPTMPDGFCMDQEEWNSANVCHDPTNNACQACEKDAPECYTTCKARGEFLFGAAKNKKTRAAGGARAPRTNASGKNHRASRSTT